MTRRWNDRPEPDPTALRAALDKFEALNKRLQVEYPSLGLTFGYIGNCERWGDDRLWMFFTDVPTVGMVTICNPNRHCYRLCKTEGLANAVSDVEKNLPAWCARLAQKKETRHA